MAKRLPFTKTNYSLAVRYKMPNSEFSNWINFGKGYFESIEIVRKQMRIISAGLPSHSIKEISFILDGKKRDIDGYESSENIKVNW